MLIGIDINETKEYVSASDKGDNPTVFLIGNLTNAFKMSTIGSIILPDGKVDMKAVQTKAGEIVRSGIKGVRGFYDSTQKKAVDLKADEITPEFLEKLPASVLYELAGKVLEFNFASEGEIKN